MDLNVILPYIIGIAGTILAHKLGVPIPMLPAPTPGPLTPSPTPQPVPTPVPSPAPGPVPLDPAKRPSNVYLGWLLQVKAGTVKLDELDAVLLGQVKGMVNEIAK